VGCDEEKLRVDREVDGIDSSTPHRSEHSGKTSPDSDSSSDTDDTDDELVFKPRNRKRVRKTRTKQTTPKKRKPGGLGKPEKVCVLFVFCCIVHV